MIVKPEMVQLVTRERTICQGDIISFNCTASSNPAIHTYQLYVNGTMVNEASSTGVWNRTMTTGGVFVYKCMVNNTIGTAMSMDVFVTVNVPSSIQSIPDKVVTEGDNLTLICNASGIPTQVSWINVRFGNRTHGNVLEIKNVSRHEAGEYRCEARNPCRNATESATVDVQFKPEMVQLITRERTVCQGDIITFNCTANSNPAVHTYQLHVNGTMVNETSSTGVWSKTMTTGGVFVYKCMVNNTIGTAMSMDVSVTVNVPSSIQSIPDKVITEGNNVTLICNASGFPEPVVSWINVLSGNRTHGNVLEFENVSRHEAGEYRCEARNPCRNATESATIDVQYAPEITNISATQTLNKDETLTLICIADGNPAPNITWTRLSTGNIVNMPLTVTGKEYEGGYRCTASNGIGTVFDDTSITVNLPAVAVALADKNIVEKGGNATLFCSVSGTPTPSVMWIHVDTGNKHYDETWFISDITFNDLGEYRCDASNRYGSDTNSTVILFKGGKCDEVCKERRRTCRFGFGTAPLCFCEEGKTGQNCENNDLAKTLFEARLEFLVVFKEVYDDLEDSETQILIARIERGVKDELNDTGLTQVRVVSLRRGSVIADLKLRFNRSIYQDSLRELLQDATKDNKLGDLEVKNVVVGGPFSTVASPTVANVNNCSMFFEGIHCDKASGALIALIVVGVLLAVAFLIGIVICCFHKKNASGRGSFQNVKVTQRQDPEG
ncbi:PREDICTED: hemicentin-1-like isoform X5 [Acropora digitifera]|uniref:hemicentin-1-like isoform X5 n=1 Tax=Acropora digitifera TaxID=70779 RepID=UPI00077A9A8E|nr:PREDICTED: hemicentin-1-like isoform X5 [Acropora digitifera]